MANGKDECVALLEAAMASQAKVSQHTVAHACMDQINRHIQTIDT